MQLTQRGGTGPCRSLLRCSAFFRQGIMVIMVKLLCCIDGTGGTADFGGGLDKINFMLHCCIDLTIATHHFYHVTQMRTSGIYFNRETFHHLCCKQANSVILVVDSLHRGVISLPVVISQNTLLLTCDLRKENM